MATQVYRGSLKAANIPFQTKDFGRTVINPQYDAAFSRTLGDDAGKEFDSNLPQVYYAENVLPTRTGLKSVGSSVLIPFPFAVPANAYKIFKFSDPTNQNVECLLFQDVFSHPNIYFYDSLTQTWYTLANPRAPFSGTVTNVFVLNGLVHVAQSGFALVGVHSEASLHTLNTTTRVFTDCALSNMPVRFDQLFTANGYVIGYDSSLTQQLYWSSVISPYDFSVSLLTGAGGGGVQGLSGPIEAYAVVQNGFILFSDNNAVAAVYSGNSRYPFNFAAIAGAIGSNTFNPVTSLAPRSVDQSGALGYCFVFTTKGVQEVTLRSAQNMFPEALDFMNTEIVEYFDAATNTFNEAPKSSTYSYTILFVRTVLQRYTLLVYKLLFNSVPTYYAMVYDQAYQRWGKIKFTSEPRDILEYNSRICWFDTSCRINQLDFTDTATDGGVLVFGKLQFVRNDLITLQRVDFESVQAADSFSVFDLPTIDGRTFLTPVAGYTAINSGFLRSYNFRVAGLNHSLLIKGKFDLNTLEAEFKKEGLR